MLLPNFNNFVLVAIKQPKNLCIGANAKKAHFIRANSGLKLF